MSVIIIIIIIILINPVTEWCLGPVVFLLDKVVACPECHEVSVVGRGRYGDAACTPDVRVTQLVGEHL